MMEETRRLLEEVREVLRMELGAEGVEALETNPHLKRRAALVERIDREILRVAARDAWTDAAREVGIASPGGMQQAKRMAVAAVDALGLRYDETSPSDIREEASK